jgi:adenosylcobinamide-GDP ribazoletransferase
MRDALSLLTTFGRRGAGGRITPRSLGWFPFVGAALGGVVGGTWWLAERLWPRPVAAGLVLVVNAACTGLLHVDGLADAADGLLPHADRDRRLEIMRDPGVGAFGMFAVAIAIVLEATALATRSASIGLPVALWCASRSFVATVPAVVPYARVVGIATPLLDNATVWPALALVPAIIVGTVAAGVAGTLAVITAVTVGAATIAFAVRRVGGFTGDVLGAAIVLAETAGLVVAAARW